MQISERPRVIVLTGATGFIGSAALDALARRPGVLVRALARTPGAEREGVEWVRADLGDPGSLRGVCEGAAALVNLASYIGRDEDRCHTVNVLGGAALLAEAARAGVGRIVHLSTAAVYGNLPHRGIEVDEVAPDPVSAASRTRLAAEAPVLAAGGTVLRPGLVLGAGDRWVVPALAELIDRVPASWDGGRALLSVIDVGELARLIDALATAPGPVVGGIHHASHPSAVTSAGLVSALAAEGILPEVREEWSWNRCLEQLRLRPGRVTERQFSLLARDYHQRADSIWRLTRLRPTPTPLSLLPSAAPWYRAHLAGA
ncbi:NAD-dependent epimerase/dehydratase family protein [Streptomyces sp. ZAF1911]|uniref:NAD-dependent epimerase/dehydratase family protein n=1 Tax=Streptomyces sp. ZAF1911 TaxID=2944129 RepID=UPI00237BC3D7|nr:NAD-dependent epimerase/dehydratase family protein [Streptomyces sp. ZAF1911]MDD9383048.1 NAD-dependent epimerase/dehydratase family protein [Streptomyces sp. ZAF1911]